MKIAITALLLITCFTSSADCNLEISQSINDFRAKVRELNEQTDELLEAQRSLNERVDMNSLEREILQAENERVLNALKKVEELNSN